MQSGALKRAKILSFLGVISLVLLLLTPVTAFASTKVWSTTTPTDIFNRPDLPTQYDILRVEVGLYDSDLDQVHFWIQFKNPLTPAQFNDGRNSWAGVLIDANGDDQEDFRISTYTNTYSKNFTQNAFAGEWNGISRCNAYSWMDLDNGSPYLGFKVSQKCLGFQNKFKVMGYADYLANDNASFDYAPDAFATIDLGDYYNPKPKVAAPVPFSTEDFGPSLSNYSSQPENLAGLVSKLRNSVVTIECPTGTGGSLGTGWAARVSLPAGNSNKTYLITNYHVISDCILRGTVDVILNDRTKVVGTLAAWDPDNDLAGIYIAQNLEPLMWQGATPLQGGWAGVLGSPKGLPGVLTTGIVSSVDVVEKWITFTAPINPGNSGGPVFDSVGRVMAIATAKARDSEGFGIGNGVPLLCEVVIRCAFGQSGWNGVRAKISNDYPKKAQVLKSTPSKPTFNYGEKTEISLGFSPTSSADVLVYSSSGLVPTITTESPNICNVKGNSVSLLTIGTCSLKAVQAGNSEFNASESILISIAIYYIKPKSTQFLSSTPSIPVFNYAESPNITIGFSSAGTEDVKIFSSSGLIPNLVVETPAVCSIQGTTLKLVSTGTCVIRAEQSGDSAYASAENLKVLIGSFYQKIPKAQVISSDAVSSVYLSQRMIKIRISSSSSLPVQVKSTDYDICTSAKNTNTLDEFTVFLFAIGKCYLQATQSGDDDFVSASTIVGFTIAPDKKFTIFCKKGNVTKKIRGMNPKCPKGYKKT